MIISTIAILLHGGHIMVSIPSLSEPDAQGPEADVHLDHVSRSYGSVVAVDQVDLTIAGGEFFSLLGPSGCGKTTTLRMIAGFERPTSGNIYLRDKLINDVPPHRRATNMVFQQLALFPHLSVFENVAFGLRLKRVGRDDVERRVKEALALVSLDAMEERFPHQLSGGQQQRVAIARALVNTPEVLLLDEPLGALDLKLRTQMQGELKALQARLGTTFIYVTHDQGEALAMSDRLAIMNNGRIEQVGTPRDIYERPRTKFVANFVGDTNLLEGRIVGHEDSTLIVDVHGMRIRVNDEKGEPGKPAVVALRPEHVKIGHAAEASPVHTHGEIRAISFQGALIRLVIDTIIGIPLLVDAVNDSQSITLRIGERLAVGWSQEHAVILPP